ncbi:MAG: dTDP-4-dehydrorhamnose 3,5-epimerase family protein [Candidatus Jorgensenbacteria bacterium]|nr:dTDP-4-dehydrorhamnose 3,5-epimerase family protein [Candidatus Jorgensenbacteria bacterium]
MIEIKKTKLEGVLLIKPDVFEDFRGKYVSPYNKEEFQKAGISVDFVCEDYSTSTRGVLRGVHADSNNWKLISCRRGRFYFVVVNCDKNSKEFRKWESFVLSEENHLHVLVPPTFGNGHFALSDEVEFHYLQSNYYDPSRQTSYRYDDPQFNIWWPTKNPILSQRDEAGKYVE